MGGFRLSLRPTTQLKTQLSMRQVLSPKLIQRFRLFQQSYSDLLGHVQRELEDNVYLEMTRSDQLDSYRVSASPSSSVSTSDTHWSEWVVAPDDKANLSTFLVKQALLLGLSDEDHAMLMALIEGVDVRGYLQGYDDIKAAIKAKWGVDDRKVRSLLRLLQGFEPDGVGARTLSECLHIQIESHDFEDEALRALLKAVVTGYLDDVAEGRHERLAEAFGLTLSGVEALVSFMRDNLNPNPGAGFGVGGAQPLIVPSYEVLCEGHELICTNLESERGIQLGVSSSYQAMLADPLLDDASKAFLLEKQEKALTLIETLQRRREGLDALMKVLVSKQRLFFEHGPPYLIPLLQKEVAQSIGLSPSTVSRIVASKYVSTSHGVFQLRQLCPLRLCGTTAKRLEWMVGDLCVSHPGISDRELTAVLNDRGVPIARRTVTKYRLKGGYGSSYHRKGTLGGGGDL